MAFLSRLFGRQSEIEKYLISKFTTLWMSLNNYQISQDEAVYEMKKIMQVCKKEVRERNLYRLPENYGDVLLQLEKTDQGVRKMLASKRAEGVTDEDIRYWQNLHVLERLMHEKIQRKYNEQYFLLFLAEIEKESGEKTNMKSENLASNKNVQKAAKLVKQNIPIYGSNPTTNEPAEDRPLPWELRMRVNGWMQGEAFEDEERIDQASSMNALIREEIRAGKL